MKDKSILIGDFCDLLKKMDPMRKRSGPKMVGLGGSGRLRRGRGCSEEEGGESTTVERGDVTTDKCGEGGREGLGVNGLSPFYKSTMKGRKS